VHETIHVYPPHCPECATALAPDLPDVLPLVTTYVWEIPPVLPQITAYVHHTVGCPTCQTSVWTDQRPTGAPPGAFGPRASALVSLLHGRYRLSDRETADYLATVWQLPISLGSIVALHEQMSTALAPVDAAILTEVQQQDRGNADETSWREAGRRCWLWTLTTTTATIYRLLPGRGRASLLVLLGDTWRGVLGCDRWSAYRALGDDRRQLCWAHLTRNLRALAEAPGLDGLWGAAALAQVETM
jgi:transposase